MHSVFDRSRPFSYETFTDYIETLSARFPWLQIIEIGRSIENRRLIAIRAGQGERSALYIGAHHAAEWITCLCLLEWTERLCRAKSLNGRIFGHRAENLLKTVSYTIVPLLNPDGVELNLWGARQGALLFERQKKMNGGGEDFSRWQANARGVDLNRNYGADWIRGIKLAAEAGFSEAGPTRYGGTYPESEPETAALCRLAKSVDFSLAIALHTQGREIYYDYSENTPDEALPMALLFSKLSGYAVAEPEPIACCAGFKDWFIRYFGRPAFTIEAGKGKNPLPISQLDEINLQLHRILTEAPLFLAGHSI